MSREELLALAERLREEGLVLMPAAMTATMQAVWQGEFHAQLRRRYKKRYKADQGLSAESAAYAQLIAQFGNASLRSRAAMGEGL